ncbi:MAG: hypothetical protein KDD53_12365, partial [Bdellovibrionales bacterium]|nr:hypothetical protein [Bdellovibrionales bacterium]
IKDKSLSVSANALQFEKVERDKAVAETDDLDSNEIQAVPLLVSGVHIFETLPDDVFGYSLITKNSSAFNATTRQEGTTDVLNDAGFPGPEDSVFQASQNSDLDEYWGGVSWAHRFHPNFSVGITNFLALRQQKESANASVRLVNRETFNVSTTDFTQSYDYWDLRALWKVGAALTLDRVRLGLAITTPSVDIAGNGESFRDTTYSNLDLNDDNIPDSLVANDRQDGLDSEYRSPMSIAGGFEVDLTSSTRLGATVEWFDSVGEYSVMSPQSADFILPAGAFTGVLDSKDFLRVADGADSVVNYGVALEQEVNDLWTGYLGFRSDYSTYKAIESNGRQLGFSNWDIWHVTTGFARKGDRSDLGLGVTYSFGDTDSGL